MPQMLRAWGATGADRLVGVRAVKALGPVVDIALGVVLELKACAKCDPIIEFQISPG